jgi:hypothetical protein
MMLRSRFRTVAQLHHVRHDRPDYDAVRFNDRGWVAVLLVALALGIAASAHADETTGTWTGQLEGRLNYFWERSTRVVIPAMKVSLEAPNGVRMHVNYLVDVISSASIAQTSGSSDGVFTELRHGIGLGAGKKFALGDNELDVSVHGMYSTEDDYKSWLYGANGSFSWNDRNSTLLLGLTRVDDTVLSNADATFKGQLSGLTTSLGFSQILSPVLIFGLGYQFVYLDGFLGNPYRRVLLGLPPSSGRPQPEAPPNQRLRHNAEAQLSWFLPASVTTLQLFYRAYVDSWNIVAMTPELRVYQQLGAAWVGRVRYRYYSQTRADFAPANGALRYPMDYTGPTTHDPKLTAFDSHQVGFRLEFSLAALGGTFLDFARAGVLDLSFDYQWCTSTFGNNVIGTAGGRLPF